MPKPLSPRMLEVLQLAAYGYQTKDIAAQLGISAEYVKKVRMYLCDRLGADNIAHAVAIGFRRGMIK